MVISLAPSRLSMFSRGTRGQTAQQGTQALTDFGAGQTGVFDDSCGQSEGSRTSLNTAGLSAGTAWFRLLVFHALRPPTASVYL